MREPAQMMPVTVATFASAGASGFHQVIQGKCQRNQTMTEEDVHEQVGPKDDALLLDEQGHFLGRVSDAGVIQHDQEEGDTDDVGGGQIECGEAAKFLCFHLFILLYANEVISKLIDRD